MGFYLSLLLISIFSSYEATENINVSLYYETLCPGCRWFAAHQLYPAFQKIGTYISLDLVPYGNAKVVDGKVVCQHKIPECEGNKIQACALNSTQSTERLVKFVACQMTGEIDPSDLKIAKKCALNAGVCWKCIKNCLDTGKGDQLIRELGKRTREFGIAFTPTIVINGKHDMQLENEAMKDFLKTACSFFDEKPKGCEGV